MSDLEILGSTGEVWDPESYMWFFEHVGKKRCPVINISGGTEIVGCLLSPLPIMPLKPCSLGGPALGMDVDIFGDDGKPVKEGIGHLVCKQPGPSMTKGFWGETGRDDAGELSIDRRRLGGDGLSTIVWPPCLPRS